jgi:hypothetical protein
MAAASSYVKIAVAGIQHVDFFGMKTGETYFEPRLLTLAVQLNVTRPLNLPVWR